MRDERPRLLSAALTILTAYCRHGRPSQNLKPWGSFEEWSDLVRQAIVWVGLSDPGETREELARSADREATALRALIAGWPEIDPDAMGLTAAKLIERLDKSPDDYDILRSAVLELSPAPAGKLPSPRSLGNKLRHLRGRVVGGKSIDSRDKHGTSLWFVSDAMQSDADHGIEPASDGCSGGFSWSGESHVTDQIDHSRSIDGSANRQEEEPPDQPQPPNSHPHTNGHAEPHHCQRQDWIDHSPANGQIRTTCGVCGRYIGDRSVRSQLGRN